MKQFVSIALTIALLVPATGTLLWLYWQKLQVREAVKEQMIEGMDEQELVWLKFTEAEAHSELHWEHSREFEYRGQMYDVVRTEVKGDTTYYLCWPDAAETELNRQLEEAIAQHTGANPGESIPYQRLFDFFQSLYYHPDQKVQSSRATLYTPLFERPLLTFSDHSIPPPVPPPRIG